VTSSLLSSSAQILAYIPSPPRGVWELGPFPLRAYALFIIIGIIVAIYWGEQRWIARGGEPGTILDVAIWAVPFGLIGGRLYHVATDWPTYFGEGKHPIDALKIWQGGLGIWGAVLFGALGAWIGCRQRGIPLLALGDAIAPGILLAQAIGRIGNYFNQELYGRETDLPWGLEIYQRIDSFGMKDDLTGISNGVVTAVVHPTFLYEMLWNLVVVGLLVLIDRRFKIGHGRLFALYVALYCVGRFGVELLRVDHASHIAGIRINLFTSVIVFVLAVAYVIFAKKGREDPADLKPLVALSDDDDEGDGADEGDESDEIEEITDEDETEVPTVIAPPKRGGLFKRGAVAEKDAADDAWVESLKGDEPKKEPAPEAQPVVAEVAPEPEPETVKEPEPKVVATPKGGLFKRAPKSVPAVVEEVAAEPEPKPAAAKPEEPEKIEEPKVDVAEAPTEVVAPPKGGLFKRAPKATPAVVEEVAAEPEPEPIKEPEPEVVKESEPEAIDVPKGGRFKRAPKPTPAAVEDAVDEPEPVKEAEPEPEPQHEPEPALVEAEVEVDAPKAEPAPAPPRSKQEGRLSGLIRRVRGK
jgi:prolipoprotein diacylglyceryl transferase